MGAEACLLDDQPQTEVTPRSQMMRWSRYLYEQDLPTLARLARLPDENIEPALLSNTRSLERVVQAAYTLVCEDNINVFDQARINSFIRGRRAFDRSFMVKLQKATRKTYIRVCHCLLRFAIRKSPPGRPVKLSHRLAPLQLILYC